MRPSPLEEAMELYQIGRFLELDILSQGCEDLILEWLTQDSLATVLRYNFILFRQCIFYRQIVKLSHKDHMCCINCITFFCSIFSFELWSLTYLFLSYL